MARRWAKHPWYAGGNGSRAGTRIAGAIGTAELAMLTGKQVSTLVERKYQRPDAGKENGADLLCFQLTAAGISGWDREVEFCPRKFRIDVAFRNPPDPNAGKLAVEVDGFGRCGAMGYHQRPEGVESNCEKSALLAIYGYRLMRVTTNQVRSGMALRWIEAAIGTKKE